jgi:hypothetical protein
VRHAHGAYARALGVYRARCQPALRGFNAARVQLCVFGYAASAAALDVPWVYSDGLIFVSARTKKRYDDVTLARHPS